jgi:hypothetical protein
MYRNKIIYEIFSQFILENRFRKNEIVSRAFTRNIFVGGSLRASTLKLFLYRF